MTCRHGRHYTCETCEHREDCHDFKMDEARRIVRRRMEGMRDFAHVLIDATNGTIYWDFNFNDMEFVAGSATNSGIVPEFTKTYDPDRDWAENFQDFAEAAEEYYEYLP